MELVLPSSFLSRVKQILPAKDNITVTTTKKLKEIDLSKVDLIISSVDIEDPEISYVKVNPLLTKDDYANILDAYTKQVLLIKIMCVITRKMELKHRH